MLKVGEHSPTQCCLSGCRYSLCQYLFLVLMGACSVQGYGEKAPGIGAFVYPGSGATCDTRPASAGATATATPSAVQPSNIPTGEEVS